MNQIQKFFSRVVLTSITLPMAAYAQQTMEYRQTADLRVKKERMSAIFGCANAKDKYCAAIQEAPTEDAFWMATSAKKQSDDKRTTERISVLECCLGVDTNNSCDSLTPRAKKDLDDCKKKVKQ